MRDGDPPPQGFQEVDHPGARVLARPEAIPWVRFVLEGGDALYEAAAGDRDTFPLPGREPVYCIPSKAKGEAGPRREGPATAGAMEGPRWAVRHFARGGRIVPALLGDRYLRIGTPRPFHELRISEGARARGIPTPRVLAAAVYPTALLYTADLVTAFVGDSTDMVEALFDTDRKGAGGASERLDALAAAGALIRAMASAGLRHGDLHAGNILLQWRGAAPTSHVLDLDRARLLPEGVPAPKEPMLNRLKRSLRKWEGRTGLRLTEREWATLDGASGG